MMSVSERRFSTGRRFLDLRIDGGIPIGTAVALTAPARSQSELLLREFTADRDLLYISTTCPDEDELRGVLEPTRSVDATLSIAFATPDSLLESTEQYLDRITPECSVVIDSLDALEHAEREPYLTFLNALKRRLDETDSIAFFHCLESDASTPPRRPLTLKRADHVWQLQTTVLSNDITNRLLITKARGYRALSEPIPLVLTDRVEIDTSRNI